MRQSSFSHLCWQFPSHPYLLSILAGWILWAGLYSQAAFSQYVPLPADPPKEPSIINGSRSQDHLTVFAPQKQVGHLIAGSPVSVAWQVATVEYPYEIEIRFYNQNRDEIYAYQNSFPEAGIIRKTFLDLAPLLMPDQTYFMEVIMTYTLDSESQIYESFAAQIDVHKPSPALETKILLATSSEERSRIYAEAGYWYSALSEAIDQQLLDLIADLESLEN